MRTSPWRDCGSITGETCQTEPEKLRSSPTGVTLRRHADVNAREILLRQLRPHFHLRRPRQAGTARPSPG